MNDLAFPLLCSSCCFSEGPKFFYRLAIALSLVPWYFKTLSFLEQAAISAAVETFSVDWCCYFLPVFLFHVSCMPAKQDRQEQITLQFKSTSVKPKQKPMHDGLYPQRSSWKLVFQSYLYSCVRKLLSTHIYTYDTFIKICHLDVFFSLCSCSEI